MRTEGIECNNVHLGSKATILTCIAVILDNYMNTFGLRAIGGRRASPSPTTLPGSKPDQYRLYDRDPDDRDLVHLRWDARGAVPLPRRTHGSKQLLTNILYVKLTFVHVLGITRVGSHPPT